MSEATINFKPPVDAPPEVTELLGLGKTDHKAEHGASVLAQNTAPQPGNLPVVDSHIVADKGVLPHTKLTSNSHSSHTEIESIDEAAAHQPVWKKTLKSAAPYFAVFAAGLILYYIFLNKTDFSTIFDKIKPAPKAVQTQKETALQALEKSNMSAYQAWILQYYFDVSDASVIDPNADNSGNGLSNFQKYLLGLNPRAYDSLGLGMADSQALAEGLNPSTGNPLTDAQKQVVDKYFDMEVIMNRLSLGNLNNSRNVAGATVNNQQTNNLTGNNNQQIQYQNQNTGGVNALGTQTNTTNSQNNTIYVAPKTGADAAQNNVFGNTSDIDQTRPGLLEIPSLKISAPLVWTQDPKNFDADLQSGVVHYPGTALPGQIGTTYISGHSSNYVWAKGSYNHVFTKLGDLADNSSFVITVYTKDGKTIKYHYVVTHRAEYKATDQAQFQNSGTQTVALSTCWPVNTTQKRLVVFGELTQTEK